MNKPPDDFDGARLICFAEISAAVKPTGTTQHSRDGHVLGPARGLAICQYPGESSIYLFYCDEDWDVTTDTSHQSVAEAKVHAEFEYAGIAKCWQEAVQHDHHNESGLCD